MREKCGCGCGSWVKGLQGQKKVHLDSVDPEKMFWKTWTQDAPDRRFEYPVVLGFEFVFGSQPAFLCLPQKIFDRAHLTMARAQPRSQLCMLQA